MNRISLTSTSLWAIALCIGLLAAFDSKAQIDSTSATPVVEQPDTAKREHSPKTATILSAILPGAGQIYNDRPGHRKWWKVPIIYAAIGTASYSALWNRQQYLSWRQQYKYRVDPWETTVDDYVGIYTDEGLENQALAYRRSMELSYIAMGVVYVLNVIDASVDGHLYHFDVSNDLSFRVEPRVGSPTAFGLAPTPQLPPAGAPFTGLSFQLKW